MMTNDDISGIASQTDDYCFHSHTQFCDGRATMAEMAEAALNAGMKHYGFTPHAPITVESSCNMSRDSVSYYLAECNRLKELYAGKMNIYAGMEIDYLGPQWGPASEYFRALPLDYCIGSIHFVPTRQGEYVDIDGRFDNFKWKMQEFFDNDIRWVVEQYFAQTHAMIDAGGFNIIGHFDKVGHNASHFRQGIEEEAWFGALVDEVIDHIAASGIIAEVNTKALADHHRTFPGQRLWHKVKKAGIPLIVNSDAHYPDLINAGRAETLRLLKNID